ncbi:hypothetical protein N7468_010051 [Penicillium chermesinum]|uniref:RBR-type E3 ubiquitin transferase n=1 Tax=Penicillium chermesinum TaxID=63820 RepID=A0A9W9NDW9_9EURO|nr:uncharacterized protein N7468_010051 [Penicillium chermesinum]KAJ5217043.1 hypothetical protein N7468_010051 [Penicillium chermesinum]KAJ6171347.1 hypothetical protein N7470_000414 [Penicillium chermesinum]
MSDTQSSSLALQLLLHDLEELESQQKDKQALGEPTDLEFAITRLREDIQTAQIRLQDSILAQSTIAAVATDQNLLASIKSEENLAIRDRGYALDLNRNDGEIEQQDEAQENDEEDAISLIMGDLMSRIPLQNTLDNGESLSLPAYRPQVLEIKKECTGCLEMTEDIMFEGACGHSFCLACVRQLLLGATTNEEMYPPRCCGTPVSPATIMRVLNYQELRAFCEKAMEWTSKERLYCANPACSKFISGSNIKDQIGTCKDCNTQTHLVCRSIAHPGIDCPDDDALQGVLELASAEEWRRCNNCRAMVELHYGCNHITCRYVNGCY